MKYLCLVYGEEKALTAMSRRDMEALTEDSLAYDETLRNSGHYLVSEALQVVESARTLRVRNGKLAVTDGPFAETKEQLLGFILIEARDMSDAVAAAAKIPMARVGSIEVRPILDLHQP